MITNMGKKLVSEELRRVAGGNGGISVKAVGTFTRVSGKQQKCVKCGCAALTDQSFSDDNGRSVYAGQECSACGAAMVYGENIM